MSESSLGSCCACGEERDDVVQIVMLAQKAPIAGHGWGCVVCNLPTDGALAVVCDECVDHDRPLRYACRGYPAEEGRVPIDELAGEHEHDEWAHRVDDTVSGRLSA